MKIEGSEFESRYGQEFSPRRPERLWCSASYPMGTWSSFSVCKRPGREADHSPQTSAEVKKMWIYTPIPTYTFMA
jgi:hypothetical protein